tara:strand:+ start:2537 stop:2866 length:330 start_codon:yes stop_codon:yes gene_type:complete
MANTFKSYTSGSIGTTLTGIYTVGSSTSSIVLGCSISNTHSSPIGGSIKLNKAAGSDDVFVVKQAPIPVGSSVEVMSGNKIVLNAGDAIEAQSDTASSLDIIISTLEIT